ncbi:hypothetical protein ANTQUA_LOCUS10356 [Anthophora quadrimaculata]
MERGASNGSSRSSGEPEGPRHSPRRRAKATSQKHLPASLTCKENFLRLKRPRKQSMEYNATLPRAV